MEAKLLRDVRRLKAWALVSSLLCLAFVAVAARQAAGGKARFEVLDVERINVVEKDGTIRLVLSNLERSPGPTIGGLYMKTREGQRPGLLFFNDKGDECGGMTWSGREEGGRVSANAGLMFDQFNQDQTVGITYNQRGNDRTAGLQVWERPLTPLADFARRLGELEAMPEGPAKSEALKALREEAVKSGIAGSSRIFVGRTAKGEAAVSLADAEGKPRLLLSVDAAGEASLRFLDKSGNVVSRFPAAPAPEIKK